jgi:hypothetical protein
MGLREIIPLATALHTSVPCTGSFSFCQTFLLPRPTPPRLVDILRPPCCGGRLPMPGWPLHLAVYVVPSRPLCLTPLRPPVFLVSGHERASVPCLASLHRPCLPCDRRPLGRCARPFSMCPVVDTLAFRVRPWPSAAPT